MIGRERPLGGGELGAHFIGMAGHQRGDRAGIGAAFIPVVAETVAHDQRAEIGITKAERAEGVRVFRNRLGRVAGAVHQDFLGDDEQSHSRLEASGVERAVGLLEADEVERGEVAGGVVEKQVFGAGIGRVLAAASLAGVPGVDGGIELHAGVAAGPGAERDLAQQLAGVLFLAWLAISDAACPPVAAFHRGFHEFVACPDGKIFILEHHRAIGVAVVTAVISLLDERPGFLFLDGLGLDEVLDVRMPILERVHLRRAAGLAAGLDGTRHLVVDPQKGQRTRRVAAAGEFLARGAQRGEIRAGAGTVFEEHGLGGGEAHDVLHVVLHALDETGTRLRIVVLAGSALRLAGILVPVPAAFAAAVAHAVLMMEPYIEPNRRVEGTVLVQAQPGEILIEIFRARLVGEIAVLQPPVGDGAGDAVDELPHRLLPAALAGIGALGGVTVEIFGNGDLGGQFAPGFGDLDVFLAEQRFAAVIGNFRRAVVPLDLIERRHAGSGETGFKFEP